jgi:uncharacterized protein
VILGKAVQVEGDEEKMAALRAISEQIIAGRWDDVRKPTAQELKATLVLALPIQEASAKIRTGPPLDDEADYELDVWAGVLPLAIKAGDPEADPRLKEGAQKAPKYVTSYRRHPEFEESASQNGTESQA